MGGQQISGRHIRMVQNVEQLLFKNSSINRAAYFTAASQMVPLISAVASFGLRM